MNIAASNSNLMRLSGAEIGAQQKSFAPVKILSSRGDVHCRYYQSPNARAAVIWLGGAAGGWTSPSKRLFPRMCQALIKQNISSFWVSYRVPGDMHECILDALAGIAFLQNAGIQRIGIVGYALGGAVALQTAAASCVVQSVITLATQTHGGTVISQLPDTCGVLLMHGAADTTLPVTCSEMLFQRAHSPKKLRVYPDADHSLDSCTSDIYRSIQDWLGQYLLGA